MPEPLAVFPLALAFLTRRHDSLGELGGCLAPVPDRNAGHAGGSARLTVGAALAEPAENNLVPPIHEGKLPCNSCLVNTACGRVRGRR